MSDKNEAPPVSSIGLGEVKTVFTAISAPDGKPAQAHTMFAHRAKSTLAVDGVMPNFDKPSPHIVLVPGFPPEDEDVARNLTHQLRMLNYYVRCFEADVQLYEASALEIIRARDEVPESGRQPDAEFVQELMDGWPVIAARDGAMSIYHFGKILSGIDVTVSLSKVLKEYISKDIRGAARGLFNKSFPDFVNVRHGTAHSGDRAKTSDTASSHSTKDSWENGQFSYEKNEGVPSEVMLTDVLSNRIYSNTWNGKVHSYEISLASLEKLAAVRDKIYEAFPKGVNQHPRAPKP